jgi:brefeldin A-resistance guanine nucleotide exchange factor 1
MQHRSSTEWNLIFALFTATLQQEEAAKISFDLMRKIASGKLGAGLRSDNYSAFLQVLAAFANVGNATERARFVGD